MSTDKVKVGDELWLVSPYSSSLAVTVTKVGKKWFTAGLNEFSLAPARDGSFRSKPRKDGSGYTLHAWRSKGAYETHLDRERRRGLLANAIRDAISPFNSKGASLEQIEAVAKLLGLEVGQ